jgi:hypothetical protein
MQNETIMPVRHGLISGTATTAAETGKGALTGLVKGGLIGLGTMAALGALALGGATLALGGGFAWAVGLGLVGALGGGITGLSIGGPLAAGIGTLVGTVFGAKHGIDKVSNERGAATMLDAQLAAYQAQAMASQQATTIYAPSAANHNYAGASTKNQAPLSIQGGTGVDMGAINGMQLQRA